MRTMINRICLVCGKQFKALPKDVERGYGKFCSRSCTGFAKGVKNLINYPQPGDSNPNWKGGINKSRTKVRAHAYDYVQYHFHGKRPIMCQSCGETDEKIEAHHLSYEDKIIIWLCKTCHRAFHDMEKKDAKP